MSKSTEAILNEIREEANLATLKKFNVLMSFFNDNFRTWKLVDNKKSTCITLKGVLRGHRKERYYVLNTVGTLLQDGKKEVAKLDNNINYLNKYEFKEFY